MLLKNEGNRIVSLAALLRLKCQQHIKCKGIVFFSTCASVDYHLELFKHTYWPEKVISSTTLPAVSSKKAEEEEEEEKEEVSNTLLSVPLMKLHGNLNQKERIKIWSQFSSIKNGVLFCTDVAARGLDLPAVDWIIQYDPPEQIDDYIHRAGRTARMGRQGNATIFVTLSEKEYLKVLKDIGIICQPLPLNALFQSLHTNSTTTTIKHHNRTISHYQVKAGELLKNQLIRLVSTHTKLQELAANAFHAYIRAYATYPKHMKYIFHPKKLHLGKVANSFALKKHLK